MASTSSPAGNPLVDDRDVDFLLRDVLDARALTALPAFADFDLDAFAAVIDAARGFARTQLAPSYVALDAEAPQLRDGRVHVHPRLRELYPALVELGITTASRPSEVGGQGLPELVTALASTYLMAGNLSVYAYSALTVGAAHLIETFGSPELQRTFMAPMYAGRYGGTMALTEPQAGSSLTDVAALATPVAGAPHHLITGAKIFISGGDHDLTENIVHLALVRIAGAPPGTKGVSLFAIPKRRIASGGELVDNDVSVTGLIHKIGWRACPSVALAFGERGDCHGYLVGEPHRGLTYMFQMMNSARLMVGLSGIALASVAYQAALAYARLRPQGRALSARDPSSPQVPIIEHADVRRMLLAQKCVVEGGLCLLARVARLSDVAAHGEGAARERAQLLVDVLTPVAKSFPAEAGFVANTLAIQVHGGYGYSSELPLEAWLRDQKLNSLHEGTTGIQALDLLGRRMVARGGEPLRLITAEIAATSARARAAGVDAAWCDAVERGAARLGAVTMTLAGHGLAGDAERMLRHARDYLELTSLVVIAWQWLELAASARELAARGDGPARGLDAGFVRAKLAAARYYIMSELPRSEHLATLCERGDDTFARLAGDDL